MTKKHFEAIAKIVKDSTDTFSVAERMADFFAAENPRFDRARFMKAAGF